MFSTCGDRVPSLQDVLTLGKHLPDVVKSRSRNQATDTSSARKRVLDRGVYADGRLVVIPPSPAQFERVSLVGL